MTKPEQNSTTPETPVHPPKKKQRTIRRAGAEALAFATMGLSLAGAFPHSGDATVSHRSSREVFIDKDEKQATKFTIIFESPAGKIKITGNENFIQETTFALALLQSKAPEDLKRVVDNVGIILSVLHGSGINSWEKSPRFFVSDRLFEAGTAWYASVIVHDAVHSELYHQWAKNHPGQRVPDSVYAGKAAELKCLKIQAGVLAKIGGPQWQIDYVNNVAKTKYWEKPYNQRDW